MNRKLLYKKLLQNMSTKQKQYEALRAFAMDNDKSFSDIAKEFGYKLQSLRNLYLQAVHGEIGFFVNEKTGPKQPRITAHIIKTIIDLRKINQMSVQDIKASLLNDEINIGTSTIDRVLTQAGFSRLSRRTNTERGITKKNTLIAKRAGNLDFKTLDPFNIDCPVAGVFLFVPYIIESGILDVVKKCSLPDSSDIGAIQAALSILLLKLIGNDRLSNAKSLDHEPSYGIFAGLNTLPKASYMGSYSCRTNEETLTRFQRELVASLRAKYPDFYRSSFINLDFHSIPHFGTESEMEKVWCGSRGKAMKGANTLFAQDAESNVIIYTKAEIVRKNEVQEIKKFVDFWKAATARDLSETLVFDCKLTSYKVLGELNKDNVKFITLRKRNKKLLEEVEKISDVDWRKTTLPIPKRKHQKFLVHESKITLNECEKSLRQIIIKDHGRSQPTFVITNNESLDLNKVLEVYAKRWHIENKLSELISFFNLNALSSPLMIRIHFDIFWTAVADTIYHVMANDLSRFENCRAKTIFRRFVNFPGRLKYDGNKFVVSIRKRAHTPVLLSVPKLNTPIPVPWLNNKLLEIKWTA